MKVEYVLKKERKRGVIRSEFSIYENQIFPKLPEVLLENESKPLPSSQQQAAPSWPAQPLALTKMLHS